MIRIMEAVVLGGSRGIGAAIAESLKKGGHQTSALNSSDVDTSDMDSVRRFTKRYPEIDILVLNTGGPPAKTFEHIKEEEWLKYHRQLFMGFVIMLQDITIRRGGFVFLISSSVIKEPNPKLVMSSAYRAAFSEVFKIYSKTQAAREITCINIAPGLIDTKRAREIVDEMNFDTNTLPMGRMGRVQEIGDFVASIVDREIKYLSGVTITFDGAASSYVF